MSGLLLGWRPGEFWAATPAELAGVLGAMSSEPDGVSGDELRRLSEMFPD
ncbi:phage tail assembly chaperone [Allosphingosinicella sp.]